MSSEPLVVNLTYISSEGHLQGSAFRILNRGCGAPPHSGLMPEPCPYCQDGYIPVEESESDSFGNFIMLLGWRVCNFCGASIMEAG